MKTKSLILAVLFAVFGTASFAQAPAGAAAAPAAAGNPTALCKDGTPYTGETKKGACKGHKGVKTWYGAAGAAAAPAAAATATSRSSAKASSKTAALPAAAAPGGGAGKVWVNTSSKTYHCEGDKFYGKTKTGSYMSEADAKAQGDHPSHGKACS